MNCNRTFFELCLAYNARGNGKPKYDLIVQKGSARSGKTVSTLQFLDLVLGQSAKHRKASIVSHSFPHLRDGAVYEFEKHMARENLRWPHNMGRHEFFIHKSLLNYFSLDKEGNKAVGPGRDILFVNEPNRGVKYASYDQLKTRTTELAILDYNPSGRFWLHDKGLMELPTTKVIKSTWVENHLNLSSAQKEYFLQKKRLSYKSDYDRFWWTVYGEGEDGVLTEGRIMPFIHRASKVPDDAIEIPSGLDWGFSPAPLAFVRMWIRDNGTELPSLYIKLLVYDTNLSVNTHNSPRNLTDILNTRGVSKQHLILADSEDPRAINDLRQGGFSVVAVKKTSVETSIRSFHDYTIYVVDNGKYGDIMFNELNNYMFKLHPRKDNEYLEVPAPDQPDHGIDACRYVLLSEGSRWRNPVKNKKTIDAKS